MKVEFINKEGKEDYYFLDNWLCKQLDKVKQTITKRDQDRVIIIDGPEGSGKSTLAAQVARYVDPTFTQERMCLSPDEFIEGINNGKKAQAVVYDEAYAGLGSSSTMSPINRLLTGMMMEMRKKNLFVILVIPSVFYLSKYAALHRATNLLHVYKVGAFMSYNRKKLKYLYLAGKRTMSYSKPRVHLQRSFVKKTPLDWITYENRKLATLKARKEKKYSDKTIELQKRQVAQRNFALKLLTERFKVPLRELDRQLKSRNMPLDHSALSSQLAKVEVPMEIKTFR